MRVQDTELAVILPIPRSAPDMMCCVVSGKPAWWFGDFWWPCFEWRYLQPIKRKILALLSKISFQEIGKVNTNYIPPLTFYSEDILFFVFFLLRFCFSCQIHSRRLLKKGKETSFSCNQGNEGKDNQQALYQCFDLGSSHQAVPSINSIHLEETLSERHPKYISTSFLVFTVFFLVGIYLWESKYWTSGV